MGSATTTVETRAIGPLPPPVRCWLVASTDASWPIIGSGTAKNGTLPRVDDVWPSRSLKVSRVFVSAVKCCFSYKHVIAINPTYARCNVLYPML